MMKDLRLECFASQIPVTPVTLHAYRLHSNSITDNKFKVIRGATWKIRNYNKCGVFENGEFIYTTQKVNSEIPNSNFKLEYVGEQLLQVQENKRIYQGLIKYYIGKNLESVLVQGKYRKYSCRNEITSKWIMVEKGFSRLSSRDESISMERKYSINIEIREDNYAYIKMDTSSVFTSNITLAEYIAKGKSVVGMEVMNDWAKNKQCGIVVEVSNYTVIEPLDFGPSLKEYYIQKGERYRVEKLSDDTPIVCVQLNKGGVVKYYPHALKPVLTREMVGKIDAEFSLRINKYVKRDMTTRVELDRDFIKDIGRIKELNNLSFETECCSVELLGYQKGNVPLPRLVCGNNKLLECGKEYQVFCHGFFKKPERQLQIGYLYPTGTAPQIRAVANAIYSFSTKGRFHGEPDQYICEGLMDIQVKPMIIQEYALGDITDYKRAANKLKKIEGLDMVIALVPDEIDEDGPYNPFKTIWAESNIPSQMISLNTANLFLNETTGNHSKFYLFNIVLGILGKTGGIPWIVKDMPGNVDCFVGLDVATMEAGIHYPACSVVFDKYGRLLSFYKPKQAQKGEKIEIRILQDIFDQVIFSYEEEYGETPKSIVIHRDGFSNENDEWYHNYFCSKGISYTIVEVRKNISSKLIRYVDDEIVNPEIGNCVWNQKEAYLVTTNMKNKKGSPNPILIEKKCGDIKMSDIITQILCLSQLHVGSIQKTRLPITTEYADKICKNKDFVPEGKVNNKLFFL